MGSILTATLFHAAYIEHVRTESDLAIPTAAYANAYADMRSPQPGLQTNPFAGITGIKLSLPGFALKEVSCFVNFHDVLIGCWHIL